MLRDISGALQLNHGSHTVNLLRICKPREKEVEKFGLVLAYHSYEKWKVLFESFLGLELNPHYIYKIPMKQVCLTILWNEFENDFLERVIYE